MWSEETKQGLLRHHPGMLLVDAFSSSEAIGHGQLGLVGELGRPHRAVHPRARGAGARRRRPRRRARVRAERGAGPRRAHPPRLLQGRGQDGGHLPHHRRRPLLGPRRLRRGGRGRLHPPAGPGIGVHQHRRARRSTPKRSKRSSRPSTASSTRWWSGSPTSGSARRSWPSSSWPPAPRPDQVTESSVIEHVKAQAGRVQGTAPGPLRGHHRAVAVGQGRLRPAPGRDRRVGRGDLGLTGSRAEAPRRAGQPLLAPWVRTKSLTV